MKNWQKILLSFCLIVGLSFSLTVFAQLVPCGTAENPNACTICDFWHLGSNIINFLFWMVAIPLSALMFAIAGVIFLTSYGSEKRIELAKQIFANVAIGLVITVCSWFIVDTLLKTIASNSFVTVWNAFPECSGL